MNIYRLFIRHESEAQPAYVKLSSSKSQEQIMAELQSAMTKSSPSLWSCVDSKGNAWTFRADRIYTVCIYPGEAIKEEEAAEEKAG